MVCSSTQHLQAYAALAANQQISQAQGLTSCIMHKGRPGLHGSNCLRGLCCRLEVLDVGVLPNTVRAGLLKRNLSGCGSASATTYEICTCQTCSSVLAVQDHCVAKGLAAREMNHQDLISIQYIMCWTKHAANTAKTKPECWFPLSTLIYMFGESPSRPAGLARDRTAGVMAREKLAHSGAAPIHQKAPASTRL